MGSMVSFWWDNVSQETVVGLSGEVVSSWVCCVDFSMGKSNKAMLGGRVLVQGVLVRRAVGSLEVSR